MFILLEVRRETLSITPYNCPLEGPEPTYWQGTNRSHTQEGASPGWVYVGEGDVGMVIALVLLYDFRPLSTVSWDIN